MNPLSRFKATLLLLPTLAFAASENTSTATDLQGALQTMLANHPALAGKQAEVEASGFVVDTRRARRYPTLSGQAGYQDDDDTFTTVQLDQPLWAFGKIDRPIAEAEASLVSERLSLLQLQRQLLEDTAVAYARVEGTHQRAQIADDNVTAHESLYQHVVSRRRGQLASTADVNLAHSRLLQAQAQKETIQGEREVALHGLKALTQVTVAVDAPVERARLKLPNQPELETMALEQSAEIRYKKALIEVANRAVSTEQVDLMPTLSVRANHDFNDPTTARDDTRVSLVIEGSLEGLGKAASGRVGEARALERAARQDLDATRNDEQRRVATLLTDRLTQQALAESRKAAVEALAATMDSYFRQYQSGHKSWLDVLNIRRELVEQRLQLAQAENEWLIASLRLKALIGGLDELAGLTAQ